MAQTIVFNLRQRLFGSRRESPETIENVCKKLERLIHRCQLPVVDGQRPVPNLPDVLANLCQALREIQNNYRDRAHVLSTIEYLRLFLAHLLRQCARTMDWLKQTDLTALDQQSAAWKSFTRHSLHFSHNLAELKALFVNGIYRGGEFRLTKSEAQDFWQAHFHPRTIVSWEEFREKLHLVHPMDSPAECLALQSTIDLTNNQHVSIFEFDVFTRLFQPWSTLLTNWKLLAVTHPAYMAFMTHEEAKRILTDLLDRPGSYIFRLSCTRLGQWAMGYVTQDNTIQQTIVQAKPFIEQLIEGQSRGYLEYPNGKILPVDLSPAFNSTETTRICVTEEQYAAYGAMDTCFELCKICSVNDKDCRIEPCGHFICQGCLTAWQKKNCGQAVALCPFCRCEIKGFEPVLIEPFHRSMTNENHTGSSTDEDEFESTLANSDTQQDNQPSAPPIPPRCSTRHCHGNPTASLPPVTSENPIESIEDIRSRLSIDYGLDPTRIDALLTLTDGLLVSRQYPLIKAFLDQLATENF